MKEDFFIKIETPGMIELVESAMVDELSIAKGKWKVFLSEEDTQLVLEKSREQLIYKVRTITKDANWDFSDTIKVHPVRNDPSTIVNESIYLPADAKTKNIGLLEVNDGWKVDNDHTIDSIPLFKFEKYFVSKMIDWARTAVFYGVGSFESR